VPDVTKLPSERVKKMIEKARADIDQARKEIRDAESE
jgi:hypothetical protein